MWIELALTCHWPWAILHLQEGQTSVVWECLPALVVQESTLILHLCFVLFFSLSVSNLLQFEVKEIPNCFVSCRGSLPTDNFSTSVSFLQKLAVSTFQLIAYWHTPDSKYLCSPQESLIQLSNWSHQPGLWFQHLRISKRGNMQMPKSPRENSSGETVIGGREREAQMKDIIAHWRRGKLGWRKGGAGKSEHWKNSHLRAQDAVSSERGWTEQLNCKYAMEALAGRQGLS